jgi:hypothetical protein
MDRKNCKLSYEAKYYQIYSGASIKITGKCNEASRGDKSWIKLITYLKKVASL